MRMLSLAFLLLAGASHAQVLLNEDFGDNGAGWALSATGYGKPMAEIAGGKLSLRPDSGGGETSTSSATLTLPIPHTNVDISCTVSATDGQFWWHRAIFELLDEKGNVLAGAGFDSRLSASPGIRVADSSRRFISLIRGHSDLTSGPVELELNFHALKQAGKLAPLDERRVRQVRVTFLDQWMGKLEVSSLRLVAASAPELLGPTPPAPYQGETITVAADGGELTLAADRPAWVSLLNTRVDDDYTRNRDTPTVPILVEADGQRLAGDEFSWQRGPATRGGVVYEGVHPKTGLRARVAARPDDRLPNALLWRVEVRNEGPEPREVTVWPLRLGGLLQLGQSAAAQRVVMPTWIGFNGSIEAYVAGCGGNRTYPQNLSMQYMALTNPEAGSGLAVWVRDPLAHYKVMDIPVSESLDAGLTVGFEPTVLQPGGRFTSPPIILELSDANWYDSARHYADWWRRHLKARTSPDWVHRAGATYHHCTGYSEQEPPLATHLPAMYERFQRTSRKLPTPMTFDLGEIPDAKRGGAEGEKAGLAIMRRQFGARGLIYMPAITEYAHLPISSQMTDWYVLRPDGTMLPAWEKNATFCPGYAPVVEYRSRQALVRVTERGADGLYVDESLAQGYHPCYNPLHRHPTPFDWGQSQRRLWRSLRSAVDGERGDVGLITEGCCDVVIDYADAFMAWPSGHSDGVPPMRVAFPERSYYSNGPAAPSGISARSAYALQLVNGVGSWFVNTPPPEELSDWLGALADWRERLSDLIIAGKVLRDPAIAPGTERVVSRAYTDGSRVLLAVVNTGSESWEGTLAAPANSDWPALPMSAQELVTGAIVPVADGGVDLSLPPDGLALLLMAD